MSLSGLFHESPAMQTIRARVSFHTRQHGFDKAARQLAEDISLADADQLFADLYAYWGDPLSRSNQHFVRSCLAEARRTNGAILQCGTSLLTLLLGLVCESRKCSTRQLWCLEDNRHWAVFMRSWLTEYCIANSHIIHARARLFGDSVWYAVDSNRLAKSYKLVICDGSRATPDGVIGTVTRLEKRLADDCVVLARNVMAPVDQKFLKVWADQRGANCVLLDKKLGFVKIAAPVAKSLPLPETKVGASALKMARPVL